MNIKLTLSDVFESLKPEEHNFHRDEFLFESEIRNLNKDANSKKMYDHENVG